MGARTYTLTSLLVCLGLSTLYFGCGEGSQSFVSGPAMSLATPAAESDASQQMQSPVLGFVYAGAEVRAIQGIPGASTLSGPLVLPAGITSIDFAPGQNFAIVASANGASGVMTFMGADAGPLTQISGSISRPDIVSFSPNGAAAVLYSSSDGRLQVIGGLPGSPQLTREMSRGDLPDAVALLAVADDGITLLEGTTHNAIYLLAAGGAQQLESVADLGGVVFVPKTTDALIFDRSNGTLSRLEGIGSAPYSLLLASGLTGLIGQTALQTDGRRAIITGQNANHLWQVDVRTSQAEQVKLPATPAMLQPLRAKGHYLLAWQEGRPAWILDTNQQSGTVYFVPAGVEAQAALPQ